MAFKFNPVTGKLDVVLGANDSPTFAGLTITGTGERITALSSGHYIDFNDNTDYITLDAGIQATGAKLTGLLNKTSLATDANGVIIEGSGGVGTFTSLNLKDATNQIVLDSDGTYKGTISMATLTGASKTWTFPNVTGTVALLEANNIFTGTQQKINNSNSNGGFIVEKTGTFANILFVDTANGTVNINQTSSTLSGFNATSASAKERIATFSRTKNTRNIPTKGVQINETWTWAGTATTAQQSLFYGNLSDTRNINSNAATQDLISPYVFIANHSAQHSNQQIDFYGTGIYMNDSSIYKLTSADTAVNHTSLYLSTRLSTELQVTGRTLTYNLKCLDVYLEKDHAITAGTFSTASTFKLINIRAVDLVTIGTVYGLFCESMSGFANHWFIYNANAIDSLLAGIGGYVYLGDTGVSVASLNDGHLDLTADGSIDFNIGAVEQIILTDGKLAPTTTADIDLGDTTHFYKDSYLGRVYFEDTSTYFDNNSGDIDVYTAANKTLELQTVVWKDINLGAAQIVKPASGYPDEDEFKDSTGTDTGVDTLAFGVGEHISGQFEIQHDYKEGSDFTFHVHWQGIDAPTGTDYVQWRLNYTLSRDGVVLAAMTQIDSGDDAFDTQYKFARSDFPAITGTNFKICDQFLFVLTRIAASGDAYAGDALMATCGLHYQIDTLGSRQIGTK